MSGAVVAVRPTVRPARPMGWMGPRGYVPTGRDGLSGWALAGVLLALVLAAGGTAATVAAAPAAPSKPPTVACSAKGGVGGLSAEQRTNATRIVAVGRSMGVPERGQVVALATAMQESTLRNIDYGDRDSLGLFQQRPSQGWGTPAQVTDPTYSSKKFYRGLLAVPGWERMPVTRAAQTVQRSAFPNAYAKHQGLATALVAGTACERRA